MHKKAKYVPATDGDVKNLSKKSLVQGTLTSCEEQLQKPMTGFSEHPFKEISTSNFTSKQPKVVCHNPAILHSQLQNCSPVNKIVVEKPTAINLVNSSSSPSDTNSIDSGIHYSNRKTKENLIGNLSLTKPADSDVIEKSDVQLNLPFSNDGIDDTFHSSVITSSTKINSINKSQLDAKPSQSLKKAKKKNLTKVVPSRYMTHTSQQITKAKTTRAQDSSLKIGMSKTSKSKNFVYSANKQMQKKKTEFSDKPCTSTYKFKSFIDFDATAPRKNLANDTNKHKQRESKPGDKASTPLSKYKSFVDIDVSAIQDNHKMNAKTKRSVNKSINVDILHARYLRSAYLLATINKTSKSKEKAALHDLNKLCEAEVKLQQDLLQQEFETNAIESQKNLNVQLDDQSNALESVVHKLNSTNSKFKELADNIDAVRHGLPVTDVMIPSEDVLELSLHQTCNVLKNLDVLTHNHAASFTNGAEFAKTLQSAIANEVHSFYDVNKDLKILKELQNKRINLELQLDTEKVLKEKENIVLS